MDFQSGMPSESPRAHLVDQIVSDSIAANAAPLERSQAPLGTPVRGRGRPKKGGAPNRATMQKIQMQFADSKSQAPLQPPPAATPADPAPAGLNSSALAAELPAEIIAAALKAPSTLIRNWTGFEGFGLDDKTANDAVPVAREALKVIAPALETSKYFPVYVLCYMIGAPLAFQAIEYRKFLLAKKVGAVVSNAGGPAASPNVFHPQASA